MLLLKSGGRNLDNWGIANTLEKVIRHIRYRKGEMWESLKSMIQKRIKGLHDERV